MLEDGVPRGQRSCPGPIFATVTILPLGMVKLMNEGEENVRRSEKNEEVRKETRCAKKGDSP